MHKELTMFSAKNEKQAFNSESLQPQKIVEKTSLKEILKPP